MDTEREMPREDEQTLNGFDGLLYQVCFVFVSNKSLDLNNYVLKVFYFFQNVDGHIGSNEYGRSCVMKGDVKSEDIHGNYDYIVMNCKFIFVFSNITSVVC